MKIKEYAVECQSRAVILWANSVIEKWVVYLKDELFLFYLFIYLFILKDELFLKASVTVPFTGRRDG